MSRNGPKLIGAWAAVVRGAAFISRMCDLSRRHDNAVLHIHLRRSRDCRLIWLSVGVCVWVVFIVSYARHFLILGSCYTAHRRIVNNITKVYIKRNNIQVELIRTFRNIVTSGHVISGLKHDSGLHNCTISSYYVQAVRTESRYKHQFGSNSLLFPPFKTV